MSVENSVAFPGCPPEIRSEIFQLVIWEDFHHPAQPFDPPALLPLSHVCKIWRELIYSTPLLWDALRLHDPRPNSHETDEITDNSWEARRERDKASRRLIEAFNRQLSRWMSNSNPLPFHLKATIDGSNATYLDTISPNHANRFQYLDLIITPNSQSFLESSYQPLLAPELQCLMPQLNHFGVRIVKRERFNDFKGPFPIFLLNPDYRPRTTPPHRWTDDSTPELTRLHINIPLRAWDAWRVLWYALPALVECAIEVFEVPKIIQGRLLSRLPKPLSNLKSFTVVLHIPSSLDFLGGWAMPVLEELAIRGCKVEGGEEVNDEEEANELRTIRQTAFEKLSAASAALRSVTFDTVPWLDKDDILTLIRSSRSISHLTLINMPQVYQPFFAEFFGGLDSNLENLCIHAVAGIGRGDTPEAFPTRDFVRFIVDHGRQIRVKVRLLTVVDEAEVLVEDLKMEIEAELIRCGIEKGLWPKVDTGEYIYGPPITISRPVR
ncbi:hypothetical protein BKA70DRAFT_1433421 [Coprinopsis sp. MPI-PUGE-AT-0042]|nr:hypothetical protein BKA70DRAFT_1433421 [Coprinopsis sp. MPI-PUGE-AT-0042]